MFVIAGVDGSERSRDAIVLAQRIAAVLEAQLLAVYVYPIGELAGYLAGGSLPEVRRLLDNAAEVAHARVRELASEMGVDEVRAEYGQLGGRGPALIRRRRGHAAHRAGILRAVWT
jgi:nucleotide-binding universal stress UspA family protein